MTESDSSEDVPATKRRLQLPADSKHGGADLLETALVGSAGLIPGVGSLLSAGIATIFRQESDKRIREWQEQVVEAVNHIGDAVGDLESRVSDGAFYDAAYQATFIALSTASEDKRSMLANALVNIGITEEADARERDTRAVFMRFVNELTPSHVRLLRYFLAPETSLGWDAARKVERKPTSTIWDGVHAAFPQWVGDQVTSLMVDDLRQRNLLDLSPNDLAKAMTGGGALTRRTTGLGKHFLDFLSGPFGEAGASVEGEPDDGERS
ncbi:hypothetical protein [Humibacter sp.]|uniref:hypothetical protein n=1 Tax=Humibacter sp. TaxID=1940291 RepID=UPI003F80FE63